MGLLDNFTSWAQSPQSQPVANGLLAAGLGILAHNRGLTSGTQAVGMGGLEGLQQYQQSKQQLMQQQLQNAQLQQLGFALKKNQLLYNTAAQLLGGADPTAGAAPQQPVPGGPPQVDAGGMATGAGGSGPGVQSYPVPGVASASTTGSASSAPVAPASSATSGAPAARSALFGNIPNNLAGFGLLTDPNKLFEIAASQYSPTDLQKTMRAAGIDPSSTLGKQILQQNIAKSNYIAPVRVTAGGGLQEADGTIRTMPAAAPAGYQNVQLADGSWAAVPVQGGTAAVRASHAAQAGGKAQYDLTQVYNPATRQMEYQPVAAVADGTNASAPAPMRNNNPGALMPGGKLAQFPDMQTGLASLDANLQTYGKQGVNTVAGVISKWAPPNENDTQAYIKDVSQRLGVDPNQKIDLSNPLVRQALSTGIALHENGPAAVFGGAQPRASGFAAAPPLGVTNATNASQTAPSKLMADSYGALSNADANYQQSREALIEMANLAQNKGTSGTAVGLLPSSVSTKISPDAAKYQKLHATYVALQGKALGSGGTDAARATIDEAVPTYDKPQSAMASGIATQLNNLDLSHLKTQFLTPLYQQGDEKTFTQQSAAFDQNIKPPMVPILQLSGDQQRAAVQAAVKTNPGLRANFEWAFNNGLLK